MKRSLLFSLMTLSVVLRIQAQEAIVDATSSVKSERSSGTKGMRTRDRVAKCYKTAIGIFHGKLKQLTNKEIVIENQANQIVSIRRSHRTKFLRNDEPIRPTDIDLDTPITVEATEESSLSLVALNVSVDTSATEMNTSTPFCTGREPGDHIDSSHLEPQSVHLRN
jgi:hypothetical protein